MRIHLFNYLETWDTLGSNVLCSFCPFITYSPPPPTWFQSSIRLCPCWLSCCRLYVWLIKYFGLDFWSAAIFRVRAEVQAGRGECEWFIRSEIIVEMTNYQHRSTAFRSVFIVVNGHWATEMAQNYCFWWMDAGFVCATEKRWNDHSMQSNRANDFISLANNEWNDL